jgi:hypothetical protein
MAASIAGAVARIKRCDDPLGVLGRGAIGRVCEELGHDWRERELDPATTVALFVQQVLHGNCPCSEVRHLPSARRAGAGFTASAYCQARSRLPLAACQALLTRVVDAAVPATSRAGHLWLGRHRVFHVDGSSFSMPDTPELREAFGVPSGTAEGCAFPVAHLLVLFSASTGLLLDAWAGPLRTGDAAQTPEAHLHLAPGDVVVGDDAFGTYAHLASLAAAGLHGLFPVHHLRIVDFTPGRPHTTDGKGAVAGLPRSRWVRSLGADDQLVEYFKPKERSRWMTQAQWDALPASLLVREVRRTAAMPGGGRVTLTMATTLTDPAAYPAAALSELRLRRWDVETNLAHLKTTMKMDVLRCKTEAGVRKELAVFCLAYNLVRVTMLEAARRQEVPASRVSFADALRWLRHARPGEPMPELMLVPRRPGRAEPRCRKRRPKQFPVMKKPREVLREKLKNRVKNA